MRTVFLIAVGAVCTAGALTVNAETILWTGGDANDSQDWFQSGNWNLNRVPVAGDDVYIAATGTLKTALWYVNLTNSTPHLKSLTLKHDNPSISPHQRVYFTVKNWTTKIWADDICIKQGSLVMTESFTNAEMSNRVWIVGNNLTLDYYSGTWKNQTNYKYPKEIKDGVIFTTGRGYKGGYGPGWASGKSSGGGYGGTYGGEQGLSGAGAPTPYGSAEYPYDPGCGAAYSGGCGGGGAVFLDLSGKLTVNGAILAEGFEVSSDSGGGSGGGILVNCQSLTGTGSILATGHLALGFSSQWSRCAGSGGRIAIHYDPVEQAKVMDDFKVEISAHGGGGGNRSPVTRKDNAYGVALYRSDPGTLWFPDRQFLAQRPFRLAGVWANINANEAVTIDSDLTMSSGLLGFDVPVKLSIAGNVQSEGLAAYAYGFWFKDRAEMSVTGDLTLKASMACFKNGGRLTVGGNLTLTNASATAWSTAGLLDVCGNADQGMGVEGLTVAVGQALTVHSTTLIETHSHATSGSVVHFKTQSADIKEGAAVDGLGFGYPAASGPGYESSSRGASHAGLGAPVTSSSKIYGDKCRPTTPGSGANIYGGGSVFWLSAWRSLTVNGTVNVCGGQPKQGEAQSGHHGGSGGSIWLEAHKFFGSSGVICADGGLGNGQNGSWGGGGGRVAICARHIATNGTFSVTANGGASVMGSQPRAEGPGGDGTVYIHHPGPMCILIK